ncbi:MAG: hypothetical protein GY838_11915 [bacterium]|nr:hypothetical protein [bacterium]
MAKKSTSARPSFYEAVFRGKPKVVRAFLQGLVMGGGLDATVFYNFSDGIEHEGKAERLVEMVGLRAHGCHVVLDGATTALLKKLRNRIVGEMGLEISSIRRVKSARMEFEFHTYAPRYHGQIMDLLHELPSGLKLDGFWTDVQEDPHAKGVEAYTAVHDFTSSGKGAVIGRVDLLVAFKADCERFPLMETEDVKLTLA